MRARRGLDDLRLLCSGPGRLCQALGITRDMHNGVNVTDSRSGLHVEDDGFVAGEIDVLPRVGIRKAVDLPLRFALADSHFVSG
jgi:DNA-3-methyladenine glycosylase